MPRRPWTPSELALMRELFCDLPTADLAALLERSYRSVSAQAYLMRLEKSDAFRAGDMSARIQRGKHHPNMIATRIKPGNVPHNKGIKGWQAGGASAAHQFKKGRPPSECSNYKPIGSLRLSKDGYLELKHTDAHPVPARRWEGAHRLVWVAAHGPIPPGHIVAFRPGQHTTELQHITADRLMLMSRADNARRNSVHNLPPELARLYQLKGAITRQVNRIHKEATP